MSGPVISAIQAVIVAGLVFAGQYAVARLSKGAQEDSTEVTSQEKATAAWQDYAKEMKDRLASVERRLGDAELREEENRRRISALERQGERDKDLIRRLVARLRRALDEIRRLGGEISDADLEVLDLSDTRLDIDK